MAEVIIEKVADPTASLLQVPERRVIRIRSPSPFRGRSMTPVRGGRSMTPLAAYRTIRDKSETPSVWRSITPFISRDEKEKTPFEIGTNILQQLASYQAIFDKALVMDISLEEERPARFILSDASVIDKACILDLGNVEILYVEDDDELEESDYRESESPASVTESAGDDRESRERSAELTAGSDDEGGEKEQKKSKKKKPKKVVKKKVEKKEESPKLKLDMGDSKPKVNKAKMFEQQQKAAAEKPMDKPPPKAKTGKLSGALAAMKAEEQKMKDAEEQKKAIEEKMKAMKAEQEAKKTAAAEDEDGENEDGEHSENEDGSDKGKLH